MNATLKLVLMFLKATPLEPVATQLEADLADDKVEADEIPGLVEAAANAADKMFPGETAEIALAHDVAVAVKNYVALKEAAGKAVSTEVPAPPAPAAATKAANGKKS